MDPQIYQCRAGIDCFGATIEGIVAQIADSGRYSAQTSENAHVVLAEVLNNIFEHSYGGETGGHIQLSLFLEDDGIYIETLDFGLPMPGLAIPSPTLPDPGIRTEDLPEGGFGWYLIHTLAPSPQYLRRGNTNILRFTVK